ncbi:MAG TPA: cyclase family protein [Nitrosopumilaceae archaeon]|nr:cyclase family protein [Nitrosopumilaceae archaeon]
MKHLDLTLTISLSIPNFPGSPPPQFISWSTIKDEGFNLELLFLSSHTGTHLDAPYHFAKNGIKIHQIPISRLIGEGILIKIKKSKDQSITKQDLINFEKKNGKIPNFSSIIFFTNWQKNLNKKFYFTNNPGLSKSAISYLVSKKINLIGIDSPSIDLGIDKLFSAHKILATNNVLIVENLSNLEKIPTLRFNFIILPLKLKDATGSPVRAVANY